MTFKTLPSSANGDIDVLAQLEHQLEEEERIISEYELKVQENSKNHSRNNSQGLPSPNNQDLKRHSSKSPVPKRNADRYSKN